MKKIIAIAKYDSFTKNANTFLLEAFKCGYSVLLALIENSYKLSKRQLNEINSIDKIEIINITDFKEIDYLNYDVIYLGLTGGPIKKFSTYFYKKYKNASKRPIIVCGYPGVILNSRYIGYSNRIFCDLILLNSIYDYEKYKEFTTWYNLNYDNAYVFGYSFEKILRVQTLEKNIVFAEQSIIPKTFKDRMYLIGRLLDYANANREYNIIIKPRIQVSEQTVFKCKYHVEKLLFLWSLKHKIPQNIIISYEKIEKLLANCNLLITVSSTVAIQSIYSGIPTAIIGDFGINEEMGINFYINSGCVTTFDKLIKNDFYYKVNKDWINNNITHLSGRKKDFFKILDKKIIETNNLDKNYYNFNRCICDKYNNFSYKIKLKERLILFFFNIYYFCRRFL